MERERRIWDKSDNGTYLHIDDERELTDRQKRMRREGDRGVKASGSSNGVQQARGRASEGG